jgi:hypothetical protein
MSTADRLDALLRAELHRADDVPVDDRYAAVLARSTQRTRRRRLAQGTGALAVAGVVATGVALFTAQPDAKPPVAHDPPTELAGTWTRVVDGERWTITFAAGAELRIVAPAGIESTDAASYQATDVTLRIDALANGACNELEPGTYRWTVGPPEALTLQADEEPCEVRREAFDGTWRATP